MKNRLYSLDVFRGLAIIGMLLADYPGSWSHMYPAVQHSHWIGCTPIDLVFPFFLFVMGVSMSFSLTSRLKNGLSNNKIILQAFRRTVILIILGLFTNIFYNENLLDLSTLRFAGVLQRIGVIYFLSTLLFIYFSRRSIVITSVLILLGYWALVTLVPVPVTGMRDIYNHPDGAITNIVVWLDATVFGNHVMRWTWPWDPEGILSTFPSMVNTLIGILVGKMLIKETNNHQRVINLFLGGMLLLGAGYVWSIWFPIIKNIWTSSYVLLTSGWALLIFASLFYIVDVLNIRAIFTLPKTFGTNALTVFVLCGTVEATLYRIPAESYYSIQNMLFTNLFDSWLPTIFASLVYSIAVILFWFPLFHLLHKKSIIIKV